MIFRQLLFRVFHRFSLTKREDYLRVTFDPFWSKHLLWGAETIAKIGWGGGGIILGDAMSKGTCRRRYTPLSYKICGWKQIFYDSFVMRRSVSG